MWTFLVIVALLGQNQAAPLDGNGSSFLSTLQQQQAQTTVSAIPVFTQQQASSSSSDSSSSDTSESSQSSEGPQQVRERQNLENMAVEQMETSQESAEVLQSPGTGNTSLWVSELVALGQRVGQTGEGRDAGEDSGESSRHTALTLTFQPRSKDTAAESTTAGLNGAAHAEFPQLQDDSTEEADGLSLDLLGHRGYEAGLELGL